MSTRVTYQTDPGYGEQEQDANSALLELDKGLRSTTVGEQCEAIVRFPRLFEKYPFPILINSAFLKLADVFRTGNNFLRLCILKVTQQTGKQLDKILNVDEFTKRIFMVIHSNDPIARAITLRTLGSIASIIADRKNAHHNVISSLDSHDSIELEAAIFASTKFAEQSKSFTVGVYPKLASMIEGLATPVDTKLKLILIFQYMHHDIETAIKVRELCTRLLPSYPAKNVVMVTLRTLSQLAGKSLLDIPQQIELLLRYLQTDLRSVVRARCLYDLKMLAIRGPHMWTTQYCQSLCMLTLEETKINIIVGSLNILTEVANSVGVAQLSTDAGSAVLDVFSKFGYHGNVTLAAVTCKLMVHLSVHAKKLDKLCADNICQEACLSLEALLYVTSASVHIGSKEQNALKSCLRSMVTICRTFPEQSKTFVDTMATVLSGTTDANVAMLLCEGLAAIGDQYSAAINSVLPDITARLNQAIATDEQQLAIRLSTLVFQGTSCSGIEQESQQMILRLSQSTNQWVAYRMARQAARYAHTAIASQIFGNLSNKVSSEQYLFWLTALKDFCQGECQLQSVTENAHSFIHCVTKAANTYHKGLSSLRAANTPSHPLQFQCEYAKLRLQTLHAFSQVYQACGSYRTCPPPAIAAGLTLTSGQQLAKNGQVVRQLHKCVVALKALDGSYGNLYRSSFDADPQTLSNIEQQQQCCQYLCDVTETVLGVGSVESLDSCYHGNKNRHLTDIFSDLKQGLHSALQDNAGEKIGYKSISCITESCRAVLGIPFVFPRYFFQGLQSTNITLALSPQVKSPTDPVTLQNDSHLTLKVEGVVQHGPLGDRFRSIDRIQLNVNSQIQTRSQILPDSKPVDSPTNEMIHVTEPHNDYFTCQFLLAFPVAGLHTVYIEVSVLDRDGAVWRTGPQANIPVKSYDELVRIHQHQQQQYARAQQRSTAKK